MRQTVPDFYHFRQQDHGRTGQKTAPDRNGKKVYTLQKPARKHTQIARKTLKSASGKVFGTEKIGGS
jgi:hypothetical protein